jgi:hypothetical protein
MYEVLLTIPQVASALSLTERHCRRLAAAGAFGPVMEIPAAMVARAGVEHYAGHPITITPRRRSRRSRALDGYQPRSFP